MMKNLIFALLAGTSILYSNYFSIDLNLEKVSTLDTNNSESIKMEMDNGFSIEVNNLLDCNNGGLIYEV